MTAEEKFKQAVRDLHAQGTYPGPTIIKRKLGLKGRMNNLNGQQTRWRREVMKELGIKLKRPYQRHMHEIMYADYEPRWYY